MGAKNIFWRHFGQEPIADCHTSIISGQGTAREDAIHVILVSTSPCAGGIHSILVSACPCVNSILVSVVHSIVAELGLAAILIMGAGSNFRAASLVVVVVVSAKLIFAA